MTISNFHPDTTTVPSDTACHPKDSFVGVHPKLNRTTATRFEGWKNIILEFCTTYNNNPDAECIVNPESVWQRAHGYLVDHSADQKKLSGILETHRRECDRGVRGEDTLFSDDPQDEVERNRLLDEKSEGPAGRNVGRQVHITLGEQAYQRLSLEEKEEVDFWVYTGCVMHKDLNVVKREAERMVKSWEEKNRTPPIHLMSKAQATAAESGSAPKKGKGGRQPERGGVKLTGLLGALVKHKHRDKGHQARFRVYCRIKRCHPLSRTNAVRT